MSHYLVSGATGFIGLALCRALSDAGDKVRALARRPGDGLWASAYACDLGSDPIRPEVFQGIDGVFHLAGIAHSRGIEPEHYWRVNVEGTRQLLDVVPPTNRQSTGIFGRNSVTGGWRPTVA